MHIDPGASGSILGAFRRVAAPLLLSSAFAGCVTDPANAPRTEAPPPGMPAPGESVQSEPQAAPEEEEVWPTAKAQDEGVQSEPQEAPEEEEVWPTAKRQDEGAAPSAETAPPANPAGEARAGEPADGAAAASPSWVHGSLSLRYRGRFSDGDQDHEALSTLALDIANPSATWISGHVLARADADLDGHDEGEVFEDLSDTYDGSVVAKLYLAFVDVALDARPEDSPGTLRLGRQSDPRLPEVLRLDGLSYLTRPMGKDEIEVGLYGGAAVHLYDDAPEGDPAYGTFVEGLPWHGGRARLDWMHLEDDEVLGEGRDDLLALGLWQEVSERLRLEGEYSNLEGDPRDVRLRALYDDAGSETIVRVGYYELLETQTTRVIELDPFAEELLEYFPFRQTTLNVSRAFGQHTLIDAGFDMRRVSDSEDVGEFNRDWERYYATATLHDLVAEGLALSVTADRWDDDDRDTSSMGADVSYAEDPWKAAIGSYYSLYKYEFLELDEREDVRTYYLRVDRELSARLDLLLSYEFEDDDLTTYQTLRLGALWRF